MKQTLLTVIILLCFVSLIAQQTSSDTINQLDDSGKKQGYWVKYHEEGQKKYEGYFKNDIPIGMFRYYYSDGSLRAVSNFYNQGQDNWTTTFHKNGKKMTQGLYVKTIKDSLWKYFNVDEILIREETYNKGVKNGIWKTYYPDGSLDEEISWKDDIRHGPWNQYYSNGIIKLKANYVEGYLEGKCEIFDTEGVRYIVGKYKMSQKNGPWIYFNDKGLQSKRDTYAEDFLIREEIFLMQNKVLKPFDISKIAYAFLTSGKVFIRLRNSETINVEESIAELDQILGIYKFVKANNAFIVNFKAIKSVKQSNDSGLILDVEPPSEIPVVVDEEFKDPFIPFLKRNLD
ncbi:LytTR family transcriptional regulator DNA-binding domain-containing protein [Bacteroidota bacterium]